MLQIVDAQWKDHLYSLDHLKDGIGLRGYGQRDPLVEYKKESFQMFQAMKDRVDEETVSYLWRLRPVLPRRGRAGTAAGLRPGASPARHAQQPDCRNAGRLHLQLDAVIGRGLALPHAAPQPARVGGDDADVKTVRRDEPKVGRNDPCPCGSGKKYKKCHGAAV